MQTPSPGYTLFELLITLALIALLCAFTVPGLQSTLQKQTGTAVINDLARTLNYARAAAVDSGKLVTLCRSRNGLGCGGQWHEGVLVFTDANGDRLVNGDDQVLRHATGMAPSGTLTLRAFPNRQYLQFTPEGFTRRQNGNFTWCPPGGEPELAQQLIFSQSGRARLARDTDGDGIREAANGENLGCD